MRVSCGTDIIEIERIKKSVNGETGEKFISTVFTGKEIEYCESKRNQKYQHYAGRFAGKEAIFKALSENIEKYKIGHGGNLAWHDFEILNNKDGRPKIKLNCNIPELESIDISISHCKDYAIANVVAIYK